MCELTRSQMDRQDEVDNAVFLLILKLCPGGINQKDIAEWDIAFITKVREAIQDVIVNDLKKMTETEFYPYIEEK